MSAAAGQRTTRCSRRAAKEARISRPRRARGILRRRPQLNAVLSGHQRARRSWGIMSLRSLVAVAVVSAVAVSAKTEAADWTSIRVGVTTEAEVIAAFGPPDEVVATFPWSEWSARWKIRPHTRDYLLRYRVQSSKSAVLVGPGGKADDVEIEMWDRKVGAVRWHYGGPSANAAAATLRADLEMSFSAANSVTKAVKAVSGGSLYVEVGSGDTTVQVLLQLK